MRREVLSIVLVAVLCATGSAWGIVEYRDTGELSVQATRIVIGDVVDIVSFWDAPEPGIDGYGVIRSQIIVDVSDYLVGEGAGQEVFTIPGGTVGDVTLHVSVFPEFELGDHVLLFLKDTEVGLVESFQGAYLTDGELIARMHPGCKRMIAESLQGLPSFLAEIETALGAALPDPLPYAGTFELPLYEPRYSLCGYDWSYKANPMGESVVINPNCVDSQAGSTAEQIEQIRAGQDAWTNAGADFSFNYGGTSTQTAVSYNGTNLYYFDTTPPDGGGYIAANFIWAGGGDISENDIVFNDDDYTWWGRRRHLLRDDGYLEHRDSRERPQPLPR